MKSQLVPSKFHCVFLNGLYKPSKQRNITEVRTRNPIKEKNRNAMKVFT